MIALTINSKPDNLVFILKHPYVQKLELKRMSKTSSDKYLRVKVHLKFLPGSVKQLQGVVNPTSTLKFEKKDCQQALDCLIELEQTGKIKRKNFVNLSNILQKYNLNVPFYKQYMEQIRVIKSLSQ